MDPKINKMKVWILKQNESMDPKINKNECMDPKIKKKKVRILK